MCFRIKGGGGGVTLQRKDLSQVPYPDRSVSKAGPAGRTNELIEAAILAKKPYSCPVERVSVVNGQQL